MNAKSIVKTTLLVFVVGSLAILAVKETRRWAAPDQVAAQANAAAGLKTDKVIAYYFHTTYRCPTCRRIEAYSREAIDKGFAQELTDGRLEFRLVNIELPENEHFVQEYKLVTKSLVLVRMSGGKQAEWTNLAQVWDLNGEHDAFLAYVQQGVREYLGKK